MLTVQRGILKLCSALAVMLFACSSNAQTLWYNGNLFGQNSLRNQVSGSGVGARTFDDFIVPDGQIWNVNSVWSNDWFNSSFFGPPPNVTQANWSIRTAMSNGNGGTIVASGINPVQFTKTGVIPNFLYEEWKVQVNNLNIPLLPGMYWLNVSPVFGGDAYNSITHGAGAIGNPKGNDLNSFFDWPTNGNNFQSQSSDFSLGVGGSAVPEPGSLALLGSFGIAGCMYGIRRIARRHVALRVSGNSDHATIS